MVFERPHRVPREARLSWQKGIVTKATEAHLEPPRASDRAQCTKLEMGELMRKILRGLSTRKSP